MKVDDYDTPIITMLRNTQRGIFQLSEKIDALAESITGERETVDDDDTLTRIGALWSSVATERTRTGNALTGLRQHIDAEISQVTGLVEAVDILYKSLEKDFGELRRHIDAEVSRIDGLIWTLGNANKEMVGRIAELEANQEKLQTTVANLSEFSLRDLRQHMELLARVEALEGKGSP